MARGLWLSVLAVAALVSLSRWVQLDFVGQMQRPTTPKVVRHPGLLGKELMGWVEGKGQFAVTTFVSLFLFLAGMGMSENGLYHVA